MEKKMMIITNIKYENLTTKLHLQVSKNAMTLIIQ